MFRLESQHGKAERVTASPIIDGYFLPKTLKAIFEGHEQNEIAIVVGWTAR